MQTPGAFSVTVTGPGYEAERLFPSRWCAADALRWAAMLRPGYSADVTEAQEAKKQADAERERLNREKTRKARK